MEFIIQLMNWVDVEVDVWMNRWMDEWMDS